MNSSGYRNNVEVKCCIVITRTESLLLLFFIRCFKCVCVINKCVSNYFYSEMAEGISGIRGER
jgi:hypothetical protein